jgi:hypothetical protein
MLWLYNQSPLAAEKSPEEFLVGVLRFHGDWKKKWQEDFVVIWCSSFCDEIHCQEMTSEDGES